MGESALSTAVERPALESTETTRSARAVAMVAYVFVLAAYSKLVGLPADLVQVFAWMWLGTIAWNIQAPRSSHLVFFRDWWPALAVMEVYVYSRGMTSHLGLAVHVTEPIEVDNWLGGGELPTQHLQALLCGTPCTSSLPARWYDGLLTCVYYTHFIAAPLVALVLYLRNRVGWISFMRRYVSLYIAGLFFYITYPMAPPWMASDLGLVPGEHVSRITGRGWSLIGLEHFQQWLSRLGNPVAAMPSLHAATAALIAFYGIAWLRSRWRFLLLLYPVLMGFMLVYDGEHYVIDIAAGWILAAFIMWACANWERGGALKRAPTAASHLILLQPSGEVAAYDDDPSFLAWIRRLPPVIVPCILLALALVGVMAAPYAAIPALLIVGGFLGWLGNELWADLGPRERLVRAGVVGIVAVLALWQTLNLF